MAAPKTLTAAQYKNIADPGNYTLNASTGQYERNANAPSSDAFPQSVTAEEMARLAPAEQANYTHEPSTGNYIRNANAPRGGARDPNTLPGRIPGVPPGGRYRPSVLTPAEHAAVSDPANYTLGADGNYTRNPNLGVLAADDPNNEHPLFKSAARLEVIAGKLGAGQPAGTIERLRDALTKEIGHLRSLVTGANDPYSPVPQGHAGQAVGQVYPGAPNPGNPGGVYGSGYPGSAYPGSYPPGSNMPR